MMCRTRSTSAAALLPRMVLMVAAALTMADRTTGLRAPVYGGYTDSRIKVIPVPLLHRRQMQTRDPSIVPLRSLPGTNVRTPPGRRMEKRGAHWRRRGVVGSESSEEQQEQWLYWPGSSPSSYLSKKAMADSAVLRTVATFLLFSSLTGSSGHGGAGGGGGGGGDGGDPFGLGLPASPLAPPPPAIFPPDDIGGNPFLWPMPIDLSGTFEDLRRSGRVVAAQPRPFVRDRP